MMRIALLTGGGEKHYQIALAHALAAQGLKIDVIGNDEMESAVAWPDPNITFLNLRGDQSVDRSSLEKILRVLHYYQRLFLYACNSKATVFHVQWENKFHFFDRVVLNLFYKLLGKRVVFTAHNLDHNERVGRKSKWTRFSLKMMYLIVDAVIVHTEKMRQRLISSYGVREEKISVIPHGVNVAVPITPLSRNEARSKLGIAPDARQLLFFGGLDHYKGLDILLDAMINVDMGIRLFIAGRSKLGSKYYQDIETQIQRNSLGDRVMTRFGFVPDDEVELYFKSADCLVLPYRNIFQSGVLMLSFAFGLPVIASDVGNFKEDVLGGNCGFIFRPGDPQDLAAEINRFFRSAIFSEQQQTRARIREYAQEAFSWRDIGKKTVEIYNKVLFKPKYPSGEEYDNSTT